MNGKILLVELFVLELVCIIAAYMLEMYIQAILVSAISGYAYGRFKERGVL